jgi:hypothetical protein
MESFVADPVRPSPGIAAAEHFEALAKASLNNDDFGLRVTDAPLASGRHNAVVHEAYVALAHVLNAMSDSEKHDGQLSEVEIAELHSELHAAYVKLSPADREAFYTRVTRPGINPSMRAIEQLARASDLAFSKAGRADLHRAFGADAFVMDDGWSTDEATARDNAQQAIRVLGNFRDDHVVRALTTPRRASAVRLRSSG